MSLEAELINSLRNLSAEVRDLTRQADSFSGKIRPAMEDVGKASKKIAESTKENGAVFTTVGHHMAMQLRRVALEGFGVTAVLGFINNKIAEQQKRIEDAGNATMAFVNKTKGIIPDGPALRRALGRAAGMKPDEAADAAQEYIKAGGKRTAEGIGEFGQKVMAPAITLGLPAQPVARLAGLASKAGLDPQQTKDAIGYVFNSGMSNEKIAKLTPQSLRRFASKNPGSWAKLIKSTTVTEYEQNAEAVRFMDANAAWDEATDLDALKKKRAYLAREYKDRPWFSERKFGPPTSLKADIEDQGIPNPFNSLYPKKRTIPAVLDDVRKNELLKATDEQPSMAPQQNVNDAPLGSWTNPFIVQDKNRSSVRDINVGD